MFLDLTKSFTNNLLRYIKMIEMIYIAVTPKSVNFTEFCEWNNKIVDNNKTRNYSEWILSLFAVYGCEYHIFGEASDLNYIK